MVLLHGLEIVADKRLPLVQSLAQHFGVEIIHADLNSFADTESIIQVENPERIKGKLVLLVPQFSFSSSINDQLMQVLLLAHQVKAHRAIGIVCLMPYLAYARQCRSVDGAYIGSLQAIGLFCKAVGIDHVFACETHEALCVSTFPLPLHDISLTELWYETLRKDLSPDDLKNSCFVSPDRGGIDRAKQLAKKFDSPWAFVEKKRVEFDRSVAVNLVGDVEGKVVIIIDDIVDTGRTAVEATRLVLKNGATKVLGCFSHAVLSGDSVVCLEKSSIERIWLTNSVALSNVVLGEKFNSISIDNIVIRNFDNFLKRG
ncbi:ribose-phosphate pyrophosphokinase [Candidatus Babeliales bacterium]|nr:ribose-phosphate pyrophosphokinase [Candidatus Babeliales bacterium]